MASFKEVDGVSNAAEMLNHLVLAQESSARTARSLFQLVNEINFQLTACILTQRLNINEKTA